LVACEVALETDSTDDIFGDRGFLILTNGFFGTNDGWSPVAMESVGRGIWDRGYLGVKKPDEVIRKLAVDITQHRPRNACQSMTAN
jgi:hypothetical protein